MPQRLSVSKNPEGMRRLSRGSAPMRALSWPPGITVIPGKPCAAHCAARKVSATATCASNPTFDAIRARSVAIFSGEPKSFSQPARSTTTVSARSFLFCFSASWTRGEMVHVQSSNAACAVTSSENERQRHSIPRNASACILVIPASTPSCRAAWFTAKTFVNGGAPKNIPTGLFRSCGSTRTTACTEKSGTKRHANGTRASPEVGGGTGELAKLSVHGLRLPASAIGRLRLAARTHHFSLHGKTLQNRSARRGVPRRAAPAFFPAFTAENKGRATFRAGFFPQQKQNRFCVFQFTAKTKPY